jgi:hypothetical protein
MALASSFFIKLCQQRQLDVAAPGPPRLPAKPIETRLDFAAEHDRNGNFSASAVSCWPERVNCTPGVVYEMLLNGWN